MGQEDMKLNFLLMLLPCTLLCNEQLIAQKDSTKIAFEASFRERFEIWNGMNAKNYGNPIGVGSLNDKMLLQRIIAGFTIKPSSKTGIAFHVQDSRALGWSLRNSKYPELFKIKQKNTQKPYYTMNPNEEFFEIYDFYVTVNNIFMGGNLKIGRQKIFFGDNRIFGTGEWSNTGRWTWDAIKLSYKYKNNTLDIFGGGTKTHNPVKVSIPFTETEFWGGGTYAHFELGKVATAEPFYAIKTQGSANYIREQRFTRHWLGTRFFGVNATPLKYDFTLVQEFGYENGLPINAFGLTGLVGYQVQYLPAKPTLCLRETYASGGNNNTKIHTFDPAFGSKSSYYGRMNINTWSNLDDREIILQLHPIKDLKIELNYHSFFIPATENTTLNGTIVLLPGKHHLGNEFDIYVSNHACKLLQMYAFGGYFWAGDIQLTNGSAAKNSSWLALQVIYRINGINIGKKQ